MLRSNLTFSTTLSSIVGQSAKFVAKMTCSPFCCAYHLHFEPNFPNPRICLFFPEFSLERVVGHPKRMEENVIRTVDWQKGCGPWCPSVSMIPWGNGAHWPSLGKIYGRSFCVEFIKVRRFSTIKNWKIDCHANAVSRMTAKLQI